MDSESLIIERRKKSGLAQEALAEKGDMTTQFVFYAEAGTRAMRPENLLKISFALGVSADYLLTGEVIDKDLLLLSDKLRRLTPSQIRIIESIVDECICVFSDKPCFLIANLYGVQYSKLVMKTGLGLFLSRVLFSLQYT